MHALRAVNAGDFVLAYHNTGFAQFQTLDRAGSDTFTAAGAKSIIGSESGVEVILPESFSEYHLSFDFAPGTLVVKLFGYILTCACGHAGDSLHDLSYKRYRFGTGHSLIVFRGQNAGHDMEGIYLHS